MEDQKKLLQFVTWLGENVPELKGQAPEQIVSTINKLSESKEGQQMLQGLIEEFESSMTGMFRKGGKLDYLLCLKKGGNIQDCGCGKKIKVQDGDKLPDLTYRETEKIIEPISLDSEKTPIYGLGRGWTYHLGKTRSAGNVSAWEPSGNYGKYYVGSTSYTNTGEPLGYNESAKQYLDRHQAFGEALKSQNRLTTNVNPGIFQSGGQLEQYPQVSRKEAIDAAMDWGMNKSQARQAYLNQKNALRNNGFSGKEMKQHARWNIIDSVYPRAKEEPLIVSQQTPQIPALDTNIEIEDIPIEINDTFIPVENSVNVQKIDKFGGNFDDAFAAARRSKLDSFVWNNPNAQYDRYNTQGKTIPSAQQQEYEYNQQLVENAVNSSKLKDKVKSGILSTLNYPMK